MLMAAEFPDEFVIADGVEIEVFDAAEVVGCGGFLRDVVAPPVDIWTGFEGEAE